MHGIQKKRNQTTYAQVIEFSELGEFIHQPVKIIQVVCVLN